MLSQKDDNRILHLVAYFSKIMVPAECNYEIYNNEFLVIIQCFKKWRSELKSTAMSVKILTNHKSMNISWQERNLPLGKLDRLNSYLNSTSLSCIKARKIRPKKQPISNKNKKQQHRMQVLLPPERIEIQPVEITNEPDKERKPNQKKT